MKIVIILAILVASIGAYTLTRAESGAAKKASIPDSSARSAIAKAPSTPAPAAKTAKVAAEKTIMEKTSSKKSQDTFPKTAADPAPELTPAESAKLLTLLNQGSAEELADIPGIAKTRALSITKARPFKEVGDLLLLDGVGTATFAKVLAHGKTLADGSGKSGTSNKKS